MLESGADANALNSAGQNPLHVAAMHGFASLVAPLVKFECQVNCADAKGNTPLHYAACCGFPDVALVLKEHGASPLPNRAGKSPGQITTVRHATAFD